MWDLLSNFVNRWLKQAGSLHHRKLRKLAQVLPALLLPVSLPADTWVLQACADSSDSSDDSALLAEQASLLHHCKLRKLAQVLPALQLPVSLPAYACVLSACTRLIDCADRSALLSKAACHQHRRLKLLPHV